MLIAVPEFYFRDTFCGAVEQKGCEVSPNIAVHMEYRPVAQISTGRPENLVTSAETFGFRLDAFGAEVPFGAKCSEMMRVMYRQRLQSRMQSIKSDRSRCSSGECAG